METADMQARLDAQRAMTPNKPLIASEYGWSTETGDSFSKVSKNVQSKYTLRSLFWGLFDADFERLIFYELIDEPGVGTGQEGNWALVHADLTPKRAYTSLKRLTRLLAGPGAPAFTPQPLSYNLSGSQGLADVKAYVLQKSNGTHYLVLYKDISSWNPSTNIAIGNREVSVTVNLGAPARRVVVHRPHSSATPVAAHAGPLSSVNVSVPDHPLVVKVVH
jgi:hypothetical protein